MTLPTGPIRLVTVLALCLALVLWLMPRAALAAQIEDFVGSYAGSAEVVSTDGSVIPRDMSVEIRERNGGFVVQWTSISYRDDGRTKEASYEIEFTPSDREGIFAAAMERNVFGHEVQLDPMKGEPYVWARISGDTLTVYSLFVAPDGGYELQQYDRTLADGGLQLDFNRIRNGERQRTVSTFLDRL